jgi:hypothetical protein
LLRQSAAAVPIVAVTMVPPLTSESSINVAPKIAFRDRMTTNLPEFMRVNLGPGRLINRFPTALFRLIPFADGTNLIAF